MAGTKRQTPSTIDFYIGALKRIFLTSVCHELDRILVFRTSEPSPAFPTSPKKAKK